MSTDATVGLIPCSLLVLAVGLVVGIIVFTRISKNRRSRVSEPACGKCGYSVRGLPTFTCPECGADLREVGIITPSRSGMSPTMRGAILVLLWTLVLPIPAMVATVVVVRMSPQRGETRTDHSLGNPASKAYRGIEVQQRLAGSNVEATSNTVMLTLLPNQGTPIRIEIDQASLGYRYRTRSGEEFTAGTGLDASKLLDWMLQAGIDRQDKQVQLEAAELLSIVQAASVSGISGVALRGAYNLPVRHFNLQGTSVTSNVGPTKWVPISMVVFWLVVWLLGCWKLWKVGTRT